MRMGRTVPEGALAGRVEALRAEALACIHPAFIWRRFPICGGTVASGGPQLKIAGTLARHLTGCGAVYLACGTIGAAFDAFQRRASVSSGADALIGDYPDRMIKIRDELANTNPTREG